MRHDPAKLFEDILRATEETEAFCQDRSFREFQADRGLQLIVERELEIIGEALSRLRRDYPDLAARIADVHKIIGLRNILAHGYDVLENEILWDIVTNRLPSLKDTIRLLG